MSDEKPKGLNSASAILLNMHALKDLSSAAKIEMVMDMVRKTETCPTCGHEKEVGFISLDEAKILLGID